MKQSELGAMSRKQKQVLILKDSDQYALQRDINICLKEGYEVFTYNSYYTPNGTFFTVLMIQYELPTTQSTGVLE